MVKPFLERVYFSCVLISELGKRLANTNVPILSAVWDGGGYYVGGWCVWKKCRYTHQQAGLFFQSRWSLSISTDFSRDGGEISEYPTNSWTFLCPWTWTEGALQHSSRAWGTHLKRMDLSTRAKQVLSHVHELGQCYLAAVLVSLIITCWLLLPSTDKTQINHRFKPSGHGRVNNGLQAGKKENGSCLWLCPCCQKKEGAIHSTKIKWHGFTRALAV